MDWHDSRADFHWNLVREACQSNIYDGCGKLFRNTYADNDEERREQREPVDRGCEKAQSEVSDLLEELMPRLMWSSITSHKHTHQNFLLAIVF